MKKKSSREREVKRNSPAFSLLLDFARRRDLINNSQQELSERLDNKEDASESQLKGGDCDAQDLSVT